METTDKLFSGFESITREQWKSKASEDLKGAEFEKKLVWKTDDGFPVQPFYTEEDVNENSLLKEKEPLLLQDKREWITYSNIPVIDVVQANQLATEMIKFGANGILFQIREPQNIDFSVLLNNLDLKNLHISFSVPKPEVAFLRLYFEYLEQKGIDAGLIKGFYETDILEQWITKGIEPDFDKLAEVLNMISTAPSFKGLVIKSHAFVDAGSNTTQELAFILNKLTDYIDQLTSKGIHALAIIDNVLFHTTIGGDYFFEIAKLRAFRILLKSILHLYGSEANPEILSSNSLWSKSFYDPNVNMLRNTTEAMSAVIGGCDALLTYPHDHSYEEPSRLSQRIALNISNLLKEESYFDKVVDPAAGSYYIESLTASLANNALYLFKEVEEKGGFMEAFSSGLIQQQVEMVKVKKENEIASRKRVYVGTNKYPNLKEKLSLKETDALRQNPSGFPLLYPQHATSAFEFLRSRTIRHFEASGFIPKVFLACFGGLAARKARASFAAEFFGTAGFEIMGEFFFDEIPKAVVESASSKADIVVMCSSDLEYEAHGAAFAEHFKILSKDKILVLAGYPEKIVENLKKSGVDTFIHIKTDAIQTLGDFQDKLFQSSLH